MSLIQTPWTSQPQQAVGIDWGNPITQGLRFAFNGSNPKVEAAFSRPASADGSAGVTAGVGQFGGYLKGNSGTAGNYRPWTGITGTAAYTAMAVVKDSVGRGAIRNPFDSDDPNTGGASRNFQLRFEATNVATFIAFNTIQSAFTSSTTATSSDNGLSVLCGRVTDSKAVNVFLNGVSGSTATLTGSTAALASTERLAVGGANKPTAGGVPFLGEIYACFFWNRALSDSEISSLSQNPWQIFKPLSRRIFVPVAAGYPTLYPSLYTNENSFYSPAVSVGDVTLTPSLFSNSNTFHSATVTLGGATQTLTPSLYSNTNTFHAPSVTTGAVTLTPSLVTNTNSFFGAVVTLDSDKILYPSLVSNSNSFYGPTVSVGAVSLLPSLFVNSNTFYNHVVGGALTDSEKIDLILDILSNRQTLDATTGLYTLYADDGVTVLKTAQAWEDSEGTQPYRGRGLKRLDALQ